MRNSAPVGSNEARGGAAAAGGSAPSTPIPPRRTRRPSPSRRPGANVGLGQPAVVAQQPASTVRRRGKRESATVDDTVASTMGAVPDGPPAPAIAEKKKAIRRKKKAPTKRSRATVDEDNMVTCEQVEEGSNAEEKKTHSTYQNPDEPPQPPTKGSKERKPRRQPTSTTPPGFIPPETAMAQFIFDTTITLKIPGILKQFEELKSYVPPGCATTTFQEFPEKNRYKDVYCLEATRVALGDKAEYIHANHVNGPPLSNKFIAAQGPMPNTIEDFWRMCAEHDVGYIFMLCECMEDGKEKCARYFPDPGGKVTFGPYTVEYIAEGSRNDGPVMYSNLRLCAGEAFTTLQHVLFRGWPDHDVPNTSMTLHLFRFLEMARSTPRASVVHCSAGIGRTGTLLAIELCYQWISKGHGPPKLPDLIKYLRSMRLHTVQTATQLVFVYRAMLELCERSGAIKQNPSYRPFVTQFLADYETTINTEKNRQMARAAARAAAKNANVVPANAAAAPKRIPTTSMHRPVMPTPPPRSHMGQVPVPPPPPPLINTKPST